MLLHFCLSLLAFLYANSDMERKYFKVPSTIIQKTMFKYLEITKGKKRLSHHKLKSLLKINRRQDSGKYSVFMNLKN